MASYHLQKQMPIENKVLTAADIRYIINLVKNEYIKDLDDYEKADPETRVYGHFLFSIKVTLNNGTVHTYKNFDYFVKDEILEKEGVSEIATDFNGPSKRISLKLKHSINKYTRSWIEVEGDDREWVNARYIEFEEAIERLKPQSRIITSYGKAIFFVLSLSIGYSILQIFFYISTVLTGPSSGPTNVTENMRWAVPIVRAVLQILLSLAIGSIFALSIMDYLRSLFPIVEIDSGPEHLHYPARGRARMAYIVTIIIIPIAISVAIAFIFG